MITLRFSEQTRIALAISLLTFFFTLVFLLSLKGEEDRSAGLHKITVCSSKQDYCYTVYIDPKTPRDVLEEFYIYNPKSKTWTNREVDLCYDC